MSTPKTYNISGVLSAVEVKKNVNGNEYATAKVTKGDKVTSLFTYVHSGIAAIKAAGEGAEVRLFGNYVKSVGEDGKPTGQTFSVVGASPEKAIVEDAPAL